MTPSQFLPVANHLWQSTLFAAVAGLLTLFLSRNRAHVRYWLWLAASVKFLVPFSILVDIGRYFGRHAAPAMVTAQSSLSSVIEQASQPFAASVPHLTMPAAAQASSASWLPAILWAVWAIGFATLVASWWLRWRSLRAALRMASPLDLPSVEAAIEVLTSPAFAEPGVFGICRPVLLLPAGLANHLTPPQLRAILTHELCHIRRRDNLATAIHMAVEAMFWFHPLVWWLGARLMDERERACDEEVLRTGGDPHVYAEGVLKVCELYLASQLACVAGVTGGDLKRRIEAIVSERAALRLNFARKVALTAAGLVAVAAPVIVGIVHAPAMRGQSAPVAASSAASAASKFEVASIKPLGGAFSRPMNSIERNLMVPLSNGVKSVHDGRFLMRMVTLDLLIQLAYNLKDFQVVGGPSWADSDRYEVIAKADGNATFEQMRPMLQSLLADRFKLTLRRETRKLAVYELTVAKGGLKINVAKEGSCVTLDPAAPRPRLDPNRPPPQLHYCGGVTRQVLGAAPEPKERIEAFSISMPTLIESISADVGGIIVDKTGFTEKFDLRLEFAPGPGVLGGPAPAPPGESGTSANLSGVSIFTALQQQLGLRLESTKGPVEVLVVDRVERPSVN